MERILVVNPGSTSTKIAVFDDETPVMSETIRHSEDELSRFSWVMDQLQYRYELIEQSLKAHGVSQNTLTCVVSRGGLLPPVPAGALRVNKDMIDYMYAQGVEAHISNVGCVIADKFAKQNGIEAYVYDPVAVDELSPLARISGMPELPKVSRGHALNTYAMAVRCAEEILKKPVTECTFIVAHIGGGCSTWLIHRGRRIDMYSDDDAGFAPERCGKLQAMDIVRLCYSGKYTYGEMVAKIRGNAGLRAHLGTSSAIKVEEMIEKGDKHAELIYEAMAYGCAKGIGDLATAVYGKVDRIILTGSVVKSKMLTDWIVPRVEWIAPVEIMAGEYEVEALAAGALRVLRGEEKLNTFTWKKENPGKTDE